MCSLPSSQRALNQNVVSLETHSHVGQQAQRSVKNSSLYCVTFFLHALRLCFHVCLSVGLFAFEGVGCDWRNIDYFLTLVWINQGTF